MTKNTWRSSFMKGALAWVILGALVVVPLVVSSITTARASSPAPLLAGETLWSGVPNYMFGAGDTYNYLHGFDGSATIQSQVRNAHVPLIRAFFQVVDEVDHTTPVSDAHQLQIAQAIQNSGAQCMANITQPVTVAQALHLVTILAPYCRYFEVFNEPDLSGGWPPAVSVSNYLAFWNSFVPQARALDPQAQFGGPALACEYGFASGCPGTPTGSSYMEQILSGMKTSNVIPDFITYHWYICAGIGQSSCLADVTSWTPTHGKSLTTLLQQDFGKPIPQGITEWSADPGNPAWQYDDAFMAQFESTALHGFEQNPYLSFATQFDLAAYAGYGALDMFRTAYPEAGSLDYTNTPTAIGSARPMFGVLASEITQMSGIPSGAPSPTPVPPSPTPVPPSPTPVTPSPTPVPPTPTPSPSPSGAVPSYAHVITILMENHSYGDIIGSSSAPYINNTLIKDGALATNYTANVSSSLPNYLALVGGSTLGLTANCEPGSGCQSSGPTIASEVMASGRTWKAYEENMTANCQNVVDGGLNNLYTIHHNPFPYYTGLAATCATNDVPYTQLANDLGAASSLPAYVFITPNLNDDMHSGTIAQGDTWLAQQVPLIQQSPACTQSRCLIAITWDEGSYSASGAPLSPHVATILLGPDVKAGARDAGAYTHYNLLHTEEVALGVGTLTNEDRNAALMLGMFTSTTPSPTPTPVPPTPTPVPPTPTPVPPTPTPNPTPSPTPAPQGVPCIELVNGVMTLGTCVGTFTPAP